MPTLTQSFDPFGNVLERSGAGSSVFGYTGEQTDVTDLVFLRARYYQPYQEWQRANGCEAGISYQEYLKGRQQAALYQANPYLYKVVDYYQKGHLYNLN